MQQKLHSHASAWVCSLRCASMTCCVRDPHQLTQNLQAMPACIHHVAYKRDVTNTCNIVPLVLACHLYFMQHNLQTMRAANTICRTTDTLSTHAPLQKGCMHRSLIPPVICLAPPCQQHSSARSGLCRAQGRCRQTGSLGGEAPSSAAPQARHAAAGRQWGPRLHSCRVQVQRVLRPRVSMIRRRSCCAPARVLPVPAARPVPVGLLQQAVTRQPTASGKERKGRLSVNI